MFREIEDIVETLKNAKEREKKCSVLIGAGCSVTAGIPTAQGFVDIIKEKHHRDYERAEEKTYPKCMAKLGIAEQRDLIAKYVDLAKINWAHIALAQLMKAGFIDRVLTTNFDPLVMRACALVGLYPAVYDLAASQHFEPDKVPDQAIFHLHGQRTGFILLNSDKAVKEHSDKLAPIFDDAGRGRVWLVAGYSGENDPVFDHLANVDCFDNKLYWVGYKDNEPADHLRERLLKEEKFAFYTKGFDADSFFVALARKLDCFPPDFVGKPFSHLENLYDTLTPYTFPDTDVSPDYLEYARKFVHKAINEIEPVQADVIQGYSDLMKEDYEKVIALQTKYPGSMHPELMDEISWAYVMQGNHLLDEARTKTGEEVDALFKEAGEKYAEALKIKPDKHEAFYNWGNALVTWARTKTGEEANALFKEAGEKYAEALKIKPDMHEAFHNWGSALDDWAQTKTGEEADALFKEAGEKYAEALKIKPDKHEAFYNWGNALVAWAQTKTGEEADALFKEAGEKYAEALKIKPDMHEAFYNWGNALDDWARTKTGEEANALFKEAGEKYAEALKIKPDMHEGFYNWGNALVARARTKTGEEADALFKEAGEKYAEALKIKPDMHKAFYNWGSALVAWERTKTGEEADALFKEAGEKYAEALKIKPDMHEAFYNWGIALDAWARTKTGEEADALFKEADEKYSEAINIKSDDADIHNGWGIMLLWWYRVVSDDRKENMLMKAKDVLLTAERINDGRAAYNLACVYSLLGDETECLKWLGNSKKAGRLPKREHLDNDKDLDPVREKKWFKDFLKALE